MTINWYPGHIAKAEKQLKEKLTLVDVVLEVIDARIPLSSKYMEIEKLVGSKPRLLILNKADLSDLEQSKKWRDFLSANSMPSILTSANSNKDLSSIISNAIELGKDKIAQLTAKGMLPRPTRAMIIGMPNVGKSSIINKLIGGKKKAKTGAKAGITKQQQWVRINPKLELLDTPGIIPMKLEDQEAAYKLAMVNSVSEQAYDPIEVSKKLVGLLFEKYPHLLKNHYRLENLSSEPTLEDIALARNLILLGNTPDINRCASLILSDFRHGRIGKITLDTFSE